MTEFTQSNIEAIRESCSRNSEAIAQSLNLCFDSPFRVEAGESNPWNPDSLPDEFNGPGLVLTFLVSGQGMLCLIPETLPIPEWYASPNEREKSRLQTLAMEWPINMLPDEFEAEECQATAIRNLKQDVADTEPLEWAVVQELILATDVEETSESTETQSDSESASETESTGEEQATGDENDAAESPEETTPDETSGESDESTGESGETESDEKSATAKILLIWPVSKPKSPSRTESVENEFTGNEEPAAVKTSADSTQVQHLLKMPVTVMVRLAEKRIQMGTLLSLTPGALITFNKSCEDMLDLYINNHLYCRGEAIKIDEKFGLKINDVGVSRKQKKSAIGI